MNDVYELVGMRSVDFTGSGDGKRVEGMNLYLTYEDGHIEGVGTDKVFVTSFASAQYYFLAKFHGERPGLRLSVLPSEIVDRIELERESDGPAPEEVSE